MSYRKTGPRGDITSNDKANALRRIIIDKEQTQIVARDLGVHRNTIRNWTEVLLQNAVRAFDPDDEKPADEQTIIELQAKIEKQKECIDRLISTVSSLKKKTG